MEVINQNNQSNSINMEQIFNGMINQMSDHIISCLSNKYGFDKDEAIREIELIQISNQACNKKSNNISEDAIVIENHTKMTIDELSTPSNDENKTKIEEIVPRKKGGRPKKSEKIETNNSETDNNNTTTATPPVNQVEEPPKKKKGRPKKSEKIETNNTTTATPPVNQVEEPPKKKRGRPKKEKSTADAIVPDDYESNNSMPVVVSNLLNAVRNNETSTQDATNDIHNYYNTNETESDNEVDNEIKEQIMDDDDDEDDDKEAITVEKITINGGEYCIDSKNRLYDPDTTELIGKYNRDDNVIV